MTTITAELIEFIAPVIENEPQSMLYIKEVAEYFNDPEDLTQLQKFANEVDFTCAQMEKENLTDMYYNKKNEIELKFKSIIGIDSEEQSYLNLLPSDYQELKKERIILKKLNKLLGKPGDYNYFMSIFFILLWIEILRKNRALIFDRKMVLEEYKNNNKYFGDSEINNNEHYEKVIKMLQNKNQQ